MTISAIGILMRRRALVLAGVATLLAAAVTFILTSAFAAGKDEKAAQTASKTETLWTVRCQEEDKARAHCEIFQRLIVKETGARVAEFAIGFPESKDVARGVIVLPLGMLLQSGVEMKIDEGKPFAFKIRYCTQAGCFAYVNLDKTLLDLMRNGTVANFTFKAADGKDVNLQMPLSGFAKALKEIG